MSITLGAVVERGGQRLNPTVQWGPGLGDDIARAKPASFFSPSYNTPAQAIVHVDGKVQRLPLTTAGSQDGANLYAGVDDHYFVSMLLNDEAPAPFQFQYTPDVVPSTTEPGMTGKYVDYGVRYLAPRDTMRFYFGPKALDELRAINTEMVRVINYGMFSVLAVPLLGGLKWVHQFIGNWGWSIVVFTILINLAMFPLRQMSVVSMRKMQAIQPQMKAIQDRYAKYKVTDPERQKMNAEVMELYKAKGVNPAAGCVPMLLTLPFLFAFYSMLSQSIEIRGAHFTLWLTNLSAPDPLVRPADPERRSAVLAAEDDADHDGSGPGQGHDVHADHVHVHVPVFSERSRGLLARQHGADHRAAVPDQLHDGFSKTGEGIGRPSKGLRGTARNGPPGILQNGDCGHHGIRAEGG